MPECAKICSCFTRSKTSCGRLEFAGPVISQVDVEFFKIFQADPYNHRKPKSSIVMDTENLLHNRCIHGINTFNTTKPCVDSPSDLKASHCTLLSLINQTFFPNKNNPVQADILPPKLVRKREIIWVKMLYQRPSIQRTVHFILHLVLWNDLHWLLVPDYNKTASHLGKKN